ncbi:hypothetical protein QK281_07965 [Aeromonas hydrophila]|uniref:hypothetical protein n=1 Tax=Aeromonas hydrophila TaxID=644 RepID=UPI00249F3993|nr:hypothetical protein [Aeromonas hydrophila]WGY33737.1 hypothetical protein QK281_07965 [Aeromonas hydrophila]HDC4322875.1 hypothetical protein [Aeromonas hydrophila]
MNNHDYLSFKSILILSIAVSPLMITFYSLIYISSSKMAEYSNLVISIATVIATFIHFSSSKQQQIDRRLEAEKQRKDRLWDINKEMLLGLSDAFSKVIDANFYELCEHELKSIGHEEYLYTLGEKPSVEVYQQLDEKISFALRVYKPLMKSTLVKKIEQIVATDRRLQRETYEGEIGTIEAMEEINELYKDVLSDIQEFILDISGVAEMRLTS